MYEQPQTNSVNATTVQSPNKVLYTAKDHTSGGREGGLSKSSDGRLEIKLSNSGSSGSCTNPEQLFAAGWSACFIGAMRIAAAKMKIRFPADAFIDAEVDLLSGTDGYVADEAHQTCPYSKATRGNISVEINLK